MSLHIRPLGEADLDAASTLFKESFKAFLKITDAQVGDADFIRPRVRMNPGLCLGAEYEGQLVGVSLCADWGSVMHFGPSVVRPKGWTGGAGKALIEASFADARAKKATNHIGYTFSESPRHYEFFTSVGLWPRNLVALTTKFVRRTPPPAPAGLSRLSTLAPEGRAAALAEVKALADALYPGLDPTNEIEGAARLGLGDTLLLRDGSGALVGAALCHFGPGSEADAKALYVKWGAVWPGAAAKDAFLELLVGCEVVAAGLGLMRVVAGVNAARHQACRALAGAGFSSTYQGVALASAPDTSYNHPDAWVVDDWR